MAGLGGAGLTGRRRAGGSCEAYWRKMSAPAPTEVSMRIHVSTSFAFVLGVMLLVAPVSAQTIGTFTWQTQPYCNVLTLTVVQQGAGYQLTGFDNQCGAAPVPVTGTAVPSGGGVAFGVAVALGSGRTAHLSATISLGSLSGAWIDNDGNTGAFVFNAAAGGGPRPAPAAATQITSTQLAPTIYGGTGSATTVARSDHTHDDRYYTEAETTALLAGKAGVAEVVTADFAPNSAFSYVSESTGFSRTFTTTTAGRLHIKFSVGGVVTCSPNADSGRLLYLVLDGVPIRNSSLQRFGGTGSLVFTGSVDGVSAGVVAAGPHTIGVGAECNATDTALWSSTGFFVGLVVTSVP